MKEVCFCEKAHFRFLYGYAAGGLSLQMRDMPIVLTNEGGGR